MSSPTASRANDNTGKYLMRMTLLSRIPYTIQSSFQVVFLAIIAVAGSTALRQGARWSTSEREGNSAFGKVRFT
jgi:hypothetical protein